MLWIWWYIMLNNSILNIYIWNIKQNKLALIFILTNAYRSTFPVLHYNNTCMFQYCSPFIERSLSTAAELAFTCQIINWLNITGIRRIINIFSIIVAEICCWKGIITGLSYWHVLEESLWCFNAILLIIWLDSNSIKPDSIQKIIYKHKYKYIIKSVIYCYIFYMLIYDIPLYINRPNVVKGEILTCKHITHDINVWYNNLVWMTGYFTLGSWASLLIS
jgi:hypothetical protein